MHDNSLDTHVVCGFRDIWIEVKSVTNSCVCFICLKISIHVTIRSFPSATKICNNNLIIQHFKPWKSESLKITTKCRVTIFILPNYLE